VSTAIGRISSLDAATRAKVQAGCNFVNAEVSRLRKRVITIAICCGGGAGVLWMLLGGGDPRFPIVVAILVFAYFTNQARKELASSYKGIVVRRIVQSLGRGLSYKPVSSLSQQQFEAMDLFNESPHSWKSEDEVSGQKNAVKYALHEVLAKRRERSNRSRLAWSAGGFMGLALIAAWVGRNRGGVGGDTQSIIFKGLVVKLDFNKNFQGHTVVVPDREGQILGGLLGESRTRRKKEMVMLENPDFEKLFSVYSTNDQEARYIITPKLMELVMEAQALLGGQLRLCFSKNSLYVAVPQNEDRFEAALFGSAITPETALGDLVAVVNLAERLVETLDLETRIWTKV